MATARNQRVANGAGMFNLPKTTFSKETQALLKVMMDESKLTNFQQRQLKTTVQGGQPLPLRCHPTSSSPGKASAHVAKKSCKTSHSPAKGGIRSQDTINKLVETSSEDCYQPQRIGYNSTKEKAKLQNVMAFGSDLEPSAPPRPRQAEAGAGEGHDIDRFEEVVKEIEERRQFLDEMEALGQGKAHRNRIMTEISQKIRELEDLDQTKSTEVKQSYLSQT